MNKEANWVCIKIAENLSTAEMYRGLLIEENIPVLIKSTGAAAYMGGGAPRQLLVPQEYLKKAKDALR